MISISRTSMTMNTDTKKLSQAFDELNKSGVIAIPNAGYTLSDGLDDVKEAFRLRKGKKGIKGYCFYHEQDFERAKLDSDLMLAFGIFDGDETKILGVGNLITKILEDYGFSVEWNKCIGSRIALKNVYL